ncbi:universal stress protein [Desulfobacula toluolica]|uniref:Universal stress protein family protein n=1 Tax=Desulfobacula toluolica (strain DSM 7467 / Tol2) TaxID=651182 RepID=K0NA17_DESTT|nr:universal stress protein [Desulfobacula toluolica]CCK80845.1 universal stress protein family protein [Desulfobacula toluolica Tol2]CCK80864.1 universal stress protein family protein [Desulfobacula toluolica Tol2]CCK80881.1 universal stress protein family protein [Desulfobacula toluolica Tol2]CCK80902.1 universal stress protein family protein [Desulfobacula toluolica Tol2]CCK80921.1 universal stress protein family protein [Desulfobacula toluolica Tol2]
MASKVKKMIFATDLSMGARYAFKHAVDIAVHLNAVITVLHVIENIPNELEFVDLIGEKKWKELRKKRYQDARDVLIDKKTERRLIEKTLKQLCTNMQNESAMPSELVEIEVKYGDTAKLIIDQVENGNCDMIVLAYHYRNLIKEVLPGQVTRKVLKHAKIPILLIPISHAG